MNFSDIRKRCCGQHLGCPVCRWLRSWAQKLLLRRINCLFIDDKMSVHPVKLILRVSDVGDPLHV